MTAGRWVALVMLGTLLAAACSAPLRTSPAPFRLPSSYGAFAQWEGLEVAIDPIDAAERSRELFGTDMWEADILPLRLIVRNVGKHEFELAGAQVFGMSAAGELASAYTLDQATIRVRESSIGTTAAAGLVVGAVAGAAAGAAIGGAVAGGRGAGAGAAIGAASGGTAGTAHGTSDSITHRFRRELGTHDFGDRVIRPGHIEHGFVYMKWAQYRAVRLLLFDITTNERHEVTVPLAIQRAPKGG